MTKQGWCWTAFLVVGCGGGGTTPVQPTPSAAAAVQGFMKAVADSNLARMADLWGTTRGPASRTGQPPNWERRIAVMRAYLRNDSFRLTSDVSETTERRALQVEIRRQTCTWSVPFVAVKTVNGSWVVSQVDLAAAGNPARPCDEAAGGDSPSNR